MILRHVISPRATRTSGSLLPSWAARALFVAAWVSVAQGVVFSGPHSGPQRIVAWLGAILFLGAFPLTYEQPQPVLLALAGAGGVLMAFVVPGNGPFIAVVATIAVAGPRLPPVYGRPIAALTGAGFIAAVTITSNLSAERIVSPLVGLLFTYVATDALRRLRDEQRHTEALLQEVIEGRDARVQAAALTERARLAREMHDILAHTLSSLSIQLEGARMRATSRPDDPAVLEGIDRAGRLAREGLVEARAVVGSLRGDSLPGPDLLPALADDFQRDAGIQARLRVEGITRELPPDGRLALYRVAQEALTNVRKHADASSVNIVLRYTDSGVELTVENDGSEQESPVPGGGFGLSGMRERAELLGGRLEAGLIPGTGRSVGGCGSGFRVYLWIPA